jgi:DNA-binding NtrC family response regulator
MGFCFGARGKGDACKCLQPDSRRRNRRSSRIRHQYPSGLELKAIRAEERTKLIPVVILTSSKEEEDVIFCYSLGANSYVRKPVDFAEFMGAAKLIGIYWLMTNQSLPGQTTK